MTARKLLGSQETVRMVDPFKLGSALDTHVALRNKVVRIPTNRQYPVVLDVCLDSARSVAKPAE
jgi:hypothetical protein